MPEYVRNKISKINWTFYENQHFDFLYPIQEPQMSTYTEHIGSNVHTVHICSRILIKALQTRYDQMQMKNLIKLKVY